jgi:predicted short-subunit dehydrogenase-like oxidoreductase (DUF2520 family)
MQVTIIGSGNVATVMGRLLLDKGHTIDQLFSRNPVHTMQLARQLNTKAITDLATLDTGSDLYIIAITDDAIAEIAAQLSLKNKLVVHTAGSVSKEILKNTSTDYGVLWPMKMIRKSMTTLESVTIVVDGSSEPVTRQLEQLATEFSPTVTRADDATRRKMHMLAAITSNFTNHLYHLAADYCAAENIDLSFFYSLIEETAQRIQTQHPKELQAGPAFRGDRQTLEKHVQLLEKYPQIQRVYRAMTDSIGESFGK